MVFVFEFVYMLDYVNEFPYVGPSLHPWNEAFLLMMDDCFDVFLDLVCENFEYFCCFRYFIREIGLEFSLLGFCVVCFEPNCGFIEQIG